MVDLGPFQEVMKENIIKILLLGIVLFVGNLLFKKMERAINSKRRHR